MPLAAPASCPYAVAIPSQLPAPRKPKMPTHERSSQLCPYYFQQRCTYGAQCKYSHGDITIEQTLVLKIHEPCNEFALTGSCKYGDRCRFLHVAPGQWENHQGATKPCVFHMMTGQCPYSNHCKFSHEMRVAPPPVVPMLQPTDRASHECVNPDGSFNPYASRVLVPEDEEDDSLPSPRRHPACLGFIG